MSVLGVVPAAAQQTDHTVSAELARQPLARFPTGIAVARIQAPGYRSPTAEGWGRGAYSIVTIRDVEDPAQLQRLDSLPGVLGIAPVNRLLLPPELQTDLELRNAAAKLRADVLLVYTLDTTFTVEDKAAPLSVVTLGLSPNRVARVVCTASAVLMDTRNGYVYGVAEGTSRQGQLASAWTSDSAVDDARRRAERLAFRNLVDELETAWDGVYKNHGRPQHTSARAYPPPRSPQPGDQPGHGGWSRPTLDTDDAAWGVPSVQPRGRGAESAGEERWTRTTPP
jgi:hypothetical protein